MDPLWTALNRLLEPGRFIYAIRLWICMSCTELLLALVGPLPSPQFTCLSSPCTPSVFSPQKLLLPLAPGRNEPEHGVGPAQDSEKEDGQEEEHPACLCPGFLLSSVVPLRPPCCCRFFFLPLVACVLFGPYVKICLVQRCA